MLLFYGLLMLYTVVVNTPGYQCDTYCITIGVISNGSSDLRRETFTRHGQQVSLIKHLVDTSEIFQIFKSIKELDNDTDVDVITLFDYDSVILRMPQLLATNCKRLIKWGAKSRQAEMKTIQKKYIDPEKICGTEILPHLTAEDPYCKIDQNSTLGNRTNAVITLLGPRALNSLVTSLAWNTVVVFYESSTETETSELLDLLSKKGVLFAIFNIDHVTDLNHLLLAVYERNEGHRNPEINVVILCQFYCTRSLLKAANEFDNKHVHQKTILKKISRWLVAVYGHSQGMSRALQACADDLDNVAIVAIPEFSGAGAEELYKSLDQILWDVYTDVISGSGDEVKNIIIDRLESCADSWNTVSKCLGYNIDTLLWSGTGRSFSSVGYVEIGGNIVMKSSIFPNSKYGYNKRQFLVSTLPYSPFVIKREVNNTAIYEGLCIDLLDELARLLNFTYVMTEPADGKWGSFIIKENLTFNGLIGQLQREEVDMVAAPIAAQADRSRVMDFSYPFYFEYTTVLLTKPDVNATKWRTLVDPFKSEVLVSIGIALLTTTVLAFLIEKYNPFYDYEENDRQRRVYGGLHTLRSAFWYMYGSLLCQGGVHLPGSMAGRTLVSCWWLFCIVIVGTYSGNLIAFLTVTKEKPPFNTLAEMANADFRWGTLSGTHWEVVFTTSTAPTYRTIGDRIIEFNATDPDIMSPSVSVHIKKVMEEKYAWIGDKTSIDTVMATECTLMSIKEEFLPLKYAFGFTNNSPHTALFSEQMIKLHEGGLFRIWKRKWWPKANFCAGNTVPEAKPISLMDVQFAFYVCLLGIVVGSVALIIELVVFKYRVFKDKKEHGLAEAGDDAQRMNITDGRSTTKGQVSRQLSTV